MSNQKAAERLILKRSTAFNCQRWDYNGLHWFRKLRIFSGIRDIFRFYRKFLYLPRSGLDVLSHFVGITDEDMAINK